MRRIHDTIIAGLGAMGSSIAMHLARRGHDVVAFDRFRPPHAQGSSHGGSRIIREAYFEHPQYVPLVRRAYALWAELEKDAGVELYRKTGGLMIGAADSALVTGSIASAREHHLPFEVIDAQEIRRRFSALHVPDAMVGVLEPRAGILFPETCVGIQNAMAARFGADLHFDEPISHWENEAMGVKVVTHRGEYRARKMIVASGAWVAELMPSLARHFTVERQTLYWFAPATAPQSFTPERCPVHLWQFDGGEFFYGFPDMGDGIKVARHYGGAVTSAAGVDRTVSDQEVDDIRSLVRRFLPDADGKLLRRDVCLYTNTADQHFWIDWVAQHDGNRRVLLVSPCSGHGFKFASVIGEIAADMVIEGASRFDLSLFESRLEPGLKAANAT